MTKAQATEKIVEACEDAIAEARAGRWRGVRQLLDAAVQTAAVVGGKRVPVNAPPPRPGRSPRRSSSLELGIAVLALFTSEDPIWGVSEASDALGMARSTAHRYLVTLVSLGQLEQTAHRKYRLVSGGD